MYYCYNMGKGSRRVSLLGRLSLSRRVLSRRFHCISSICGERDTRYGYLYARQSIPAIATRDAMLL